MNNNTSNRERKVIVTFPLFPVDFTEIVNQLASSDISFTYNSRYGSIEAHLTEAFINSLKSNYQIATELQPLSEELLETTRNILLDCDDNWLQLYEIGVVQPNEHGDDYYRVITSAELYDDEITFNCEDGGEVYLYNLTEDDRYRVLQAIIDCK